jgi:3(or 17)beta-hydroxysteroid dehydrogenase
MSEGVFLGCKHAIPAIKASGGGSIINMSSVASHIGYPVYFAYSAAKGAVRSMTKAIAVHCQMNKYNVRCNSIHAGAIDTQMVRDATKTLGMEMSYWEQTPTGLGQPQDVATSPATSTGPRCCSTTRSRYSEPRHGGRGRRGPVP